MPKIEVSLTGDMLQFKQEVFSTACSSMLHEQGATWRVANGIHVLRFNVCALMCIRNKCKEKGWILYFSPEVQARMNSVLQPLKEYTGFLNVKTTPWEHQKHATRLILGNKGVYLNYGMGTGKTKIVLDAINTCKPKNTLIIAPLMVAKYTWPLEIEKHACIPLNVCAEFGTKATRIKAIKRISERTGHNVFVLNYDSIRIDDIYNLISTLNIDFLVIDEAHNIKTATTKAAKAVLNLTKTCTTLEHIVCMSGTPIGASFVDLWTPYRILNPHIFHNSAYMFKKALAELDEWGNVEQLKEEYEDIITICKDLVMDTVCTQDVVDLPEYQHVEHFVELDKPSRELYKRVKVGYNIMELTHNNALTRLNILRQITGGFYITKEGTLHLGNAKVNALADVIKGIDSIEPVVIFCCYTQDIVNIVTTCDKHDWTYSVLNGANDEYDEWKNGDTKILIVQLQSGSTGLDFTRAHYAIYYNNTYSYTTYTQSLARLHRPGQIHNVVYIHMIVKDSVDQTIRQALEYKTDVITALLEGKVYL